MREGGGGGLGLLWLLCVLAAVVMTPVVTASGERESDEAGVFDHLNETELERLLSELQIEEEDKLKPVNPDLGAFADFVPAARKAKTVGDLIYFGTLAVDRGQVQITKTFTEQAHRFNKAVRNLSSVMVTGAPILTLTLHDHPAPSPDWMLHVTGIHLHTHEDTSYLLLGSVRSREQRLVTWSSASNTLTTLATFQVTDVSIDKVDRIAIQENDGTIFMVLGSSHSRLVTAVCVQMANNRVTLPQVLAQRGVVGALHMFKAEGNVYLVVGESHYLTPGDGGGRTELYLLVGEFYDKQESLVFDATGVKDITSFASQGKHYIVLGMENPEGSKVYALDLGTKKVTFHVEGGVSLALVQFLPETHVQQVVHFRDQADLKHFVVVLSRVSAATVYWWNDNRLVKWQTLESHFAPGLSGSLALLPLPNFEHLIFASAGPNITIYTYHTTGTHQPSFIVNTACQAVRDMVATKLGSDNLLVYVCEGPVTRLEARQVHLEDIIIPTTETGPGEQPNLLGACLDNLRTILDSRKPHVAFLKHVVDTDALMTVDHNQVWSGPITVSDVRVEQSSSLQHTVVIPPGGGGMNQSMGEYEAMVARLQAEIREVQAGLGSILYYTGTQTIRNPISTASLFSSKAHFDVVSVSRLHGIPLASLSKEVLLDGPDQTITGHWQLGQLTSQRVTTRSHHPAGTLNGVLTADFMRRSVADQVVTGRHTYRSLSAGRICHTQCERNLPIFVNGIDTSTIVTQGADVTFTARKTFNRVVVRDTLDAVTINEVPLGLVLDQAIFTDVAGTQVLAGRHTIQRLTVGGNLDVGAVNGINVQDLDKAVVKKHGNYRMAGSLVYKNNLSVLGNIQVQSVNGVPWGELLPLNAPVSVTGSYTFTRATVSAALRSDNINGVDLSREAVLVDVDQTIQGRIRFLQTVRVTGAAGVRMAEGITLNGIDPSEVATGQQVTGGGGTVVVVVEQAMNITSMQVNGNIVISSINGVDLRELERRYWRKSEQQEIGVPVHIRDAVFLGGVEGSTLNGHAITDYLRTDVNQRITGRYTFQGPVEIRGNLVVAAGRTVAGVDVATLSSRVVTLNTQQNVEAEVIFSGRVTVLDDVDVRGDSTVLQVLSRALRLDETIPHTGHLRFAGGAVMDVLKVTNSDLTVTTLNGFDIAAAASDLVLVDQDATITGGGGLRFSGNVNIRELRVSGLVDGVDIRRMQSRALRTSSRSPQVVSATLIVEGDVHFDTAPTLNRVNGEHWVTHLGNVVQAGQTKRIEGRKLFAGGLRVATNLKAKRINGVEIGALASRILRKSSQQVISAPYTFTSDVTADELTASVIDGVNMDDVVLLEQGGDIGGTVTFAEDVILLAGLTADTNILDSCDFGKLVLGPELGGAGGNLVDVPIEIETLVVDGKTFLSSTASITSHNVDILQFLNSLVLKSADQVITANVNFLNDIRVGEMRAAVVDGVDVEALFRQAVLRGDDVVIECDLHLTEGLQVGRLEVQAGVGGVDDKGVNLNGVDLSELQRRAVRRDGGTYVLRGRKVFTAGLATHRLRAASVAGVAVRDMVTVGRSSRPLPHLVFKGPVVVLGDLKVGGLVDGVDLARLFSERVRIDVHQTLLATYHFDALRIEGDITIHSINNVTIADLVLRSGVVRQVITGRKVLSGGLQVNGAIQVASLNGVDVTALNRTVVRLDQGSAVIRSDVIFEGEVRCLAGTEVRQTVNGVDFSELARLVSLIQQRLAQEKQRFGIILSQFGSLNEDNYLKARELYAEMASLERVFLGQDTIVFGDLWVGVIPGVGDRLALKITKCPVILCGCDIECHYFEIGNDTSLTPVHHLVNNVAIKTHVLRGGRYLLMLHSECVSGRDMQVKISLHDSSASVTLQGVFLHCDMFVDGGVDYLVVALYRKENKNVYAYNGYYRQDNENEEVITEVVVVRVDAAASGMQVVSRWMADAFIMDLDVARAGDSWFLLLANGFGDTSVDRFFTPSEIYRWDSSTTQFRLEEKHMACRVSSGAFVQVMGETFMVLTQSKDKPPKDRKFAASCSSKVLVFRYNKAADEFVEYQSIAAYGVVSQTTLKVDRSLYLILVSPTEHCVFVCLYKHSEGFVIMHKVFLVSPVSVVAVNAGEDMYLLVSTVTGLQRYKVFVKGVDPDTLYLHPDQDPNTRYLY